MRNHTLLRSIPLAALLLGCAAQTRYAGIAPQQLSDEQLVEEIASAAEGLGFAMDRTSYLIAVRPEPAYVLTSSASTFAGTVNATYNAYTMPVGYGAATNGTVAASASGASATRYQYTDARANERLGNALAMAISQAREKAYRQRGQEVWAEYQHRVTIRRQQTERIIAEFFEANPELREKIPLVAAVSPWIAAEGESDPVRTLEQTKQTIESLVRGEGVSGAWYGMFSQTSRSPEGEVSAFSEFVRLDLVQEDRRVRGTGMLGTGERIELEGEINGGRMVAMVANTSSAINVSLTALVATSQITGEFSGHGPGQTLSGTFAFLR